MPRQREAFTTHSEPVGVLAILAATLLGLAGIGFWINLFGIWIDWNEPFALVGDKWRAVAQPHLEPVFGWLPSTLETLFNFEWPAWGYDYIAASLLFDLGIAFGMGPDLIKSLRPPPEIEDDAQERVIGAFVGRDIAETNRGWRLPTMTELKSLPGVVFKGFGYGIAALIACAFIWPFFLISVPFAFLSLITKQRASHFVKMTYVLFAPAMFATVALAANYIQSTLR